MTTEEIGKLKRYEEAKHLIKELETEVEGMKEDILSFLPEGTDVETADGKFTVVRRRVWTYTPGTVDLEKMVKDKKKEEEQTGLAKAEDGDAFIMYKAKKHE